IRCEEEMYPLHSPQQCERTDDDDQEQAEQERHHHLRCTFQTILHSLRHNEGGQEYEYDLRQKRIQRDGSDYFKCKAIVVYLYDIHHFPECNSHIDEYPSTDDTVE